MARPLVSDSDSREKKNGLLFLARVLFFQLPSPLLSFWRTTRGAYLYDEEIV